MDATRSRRVKSPVHQQWYAGWRLVRFASHLGFMEPAKVPEGAVACVTAGAPNVGQVSNLPNEIKLQTCPTLTREVRCWKSRAGSSALN